MFRPRLIPVLLLRDKALVKSIRFRDYRYIGDPLNAVRLFNELQADELLFLDIEASRQGRTISPKLLAAIAEEAEMPFGIGGGITTIAQIRDIMAAGAEKAVIGAAAALQPYFVRAASDHFGASSVSVCIDVRQNLFRQEKTWIHNGRKATAYSPTALARLMEAQGAGEIIVQSIERDGAMNGYDLPLIRRVSEAVSIPVVALGGAGSDDDFRNAYHEGLASALAAGSLFLFQGPRKGVLINYPQTTAAIFA